MSFRVTINRSAFRDEAVVYERRGHETHAVYTQIAIAPNYGAIRIVPVLLVLVCARMKTVHVPGNRLSGSLTTT